MCYANYLGNCLYCGHVKQPFSPILLSPELLESIKLTDGEVPILEFHQRRVDRSRRVYYAKSPAFRLTEVLKSLPLPQTGTHKIRLLYGAQLIDYEIVPYEIRPVRSLKVVHADTLRYARKYADRADIQRLYEQRGRYDDIMIVQRGYIADSSYANLAFFDGNFWYTPAWPLLRGARREYLLERGILRPSVIRLRDLANFESVRLVNSMMEWEEGPTLPVTAVIR